MTSPRSKRPIHVGDRVTYQYTPVDGFPPMAGTGTVRTIQPDRAYVHPDGLGPDFTIRLRPSEITKIISTAQHARDFLSFAIDHGWAASFVPRVDNSGAPYVTVTAAHSPDTEIRASWHTRDTGTYRLMSCITRGGRRDWYDITLTAAQTLIETTPRDDA